jgi:hypothetical protein
MSDARHNITAQNTLRIFARRELELWQGLVAPTTLNDVAAIFDLDMTRPFAGRLGREHLPATGFAASAEGFPQGVRVWMMNDHVVLIDAIDVELPGGLKSLLSVIGNPETKLDSYLGTFEIEGSEWVYCQSGLTLYINPENGALLRVAVFASTTLTEYERDLQLDLKMVRLPAFSGRAKEKSL